METKDATQARAWFTGCAAAGMRSWMVQSRLVLEDRGGGWFMLLDAKVHKRANKVKRSTAAPSIMRVITSVWEGGREGMANAAARRKCDERFT